MKVSNLLKGRKGQKGRKCKYDIALKRKVVSDYMNGNQSSTHLVNITIFRIKVLAVGQSNFLRNLWRKQIFNR